VRIGNVNGRLMLVEPETNSGVDVATLSHGRFGPDPQSVYAVWDDFREFVASSGWQDQPKRHFTEAELGPPVPAPSQVFAIGLNYRDHVAESGFEIPVSGPVVFTKFPTSITGPYGEVILPTGGHTDWEAELVVVLARRAYQVDASQAWDYVAGLTVGQDLSERLLQMAADPPQFSLGKSFPGFAPTGPWVVSVEEFSDPDDLQLTCEINGEEVQNARTSRMIFPVPELIAQLSSVLPLEAGDLIFTGTPSGTGIGRSPQRWLTKKDQLISRIDGIGHLCQTFG
jgi:2-keto-4-pentenoate hydratase/2-oxohepta-3-ene-1,7-dioic acid hydratase in catechol pathway